MRRAAIILAMAVLMCGVAVSQQSAVVENSGHIGSLTIDGVQRAKDFDVPPKTKTINLYDYCESYDVAHPCPAKTQKKLYCTDRSRFLLMSEDGKWHCLALAAEVPARGE